MIFYRLVMGRYASEAWSGSGANQYGGRWNHKGHPAVYVSASISLASLEILVHVKKDAVLNQYQLFSIDIPDDQIEYLDQHWLPEDWQENPAPVSTMDLGTGWLQATSALALVLPSCIIPYENNAILNPLHPAFHQALASVQQYPLFLIPVWQKKPHPESRCGFVSQNQGTVAVALSP
jgi:RES domain-containing protein